MNGNIALTATMRIMSKSEQNSPIIGENKTRLAAGSGLMLGKLLFAAERWPAFDAFVVVSFPVGKIRSDPKEWLNIESDIGSVLEENPD